MKTILKPDHFDNFFFPFFSDMNDWLPAIQMQRTCTQSGV